MSELRILLATASAAYEGQVRGAFDATVNGDLRRWDAVDDGAQALLARLDGEAPDVVAVGPDLALADALDLASHIERHRPEISVILVNDPTPELWREALRAGVTDVLAPDADASEIRQVFDRAIEVATRRRDNLTADSRNEGRSGRIITVLSPKGGSGKTTVATNLAVGLATAHPDEVVLVDLDTQFGDCSSALRLTPEHDLLDAVRTSSSLDSLALKSFLTPHASGLWTLCSPDSPVDGDEIPAVPARAVVERLAEEFRYVLVDTCAGLTEHALSVIDVSTDLLLICGMDVASIRSLRKEIDVLDKLGATHQRRHFVINRADSKVGLDIKDLEATVGMPVDVAIPSSRLVPLSMNQGLPLVESQPRSPVGKQFQLLVDRFVDVPATGRPESPRRKLLRRDAR